MKELKFTKPDLRQSIEIAKMKEAGATYYDIALKYQTNEKRIREALIRGRDWIAHYKKRGEDGAT